MVRALVGHKGVQGEHWVGSYDGGAQYSLLVLDAPSVTVRAPSAQTRYALCSAKA